ERVTEVAVPVLTALERLEVVEHARKAVALDQVVGHQERQLVGGQRAFLEVAHREAAGVAERLEVQPRGHERRVIADPRGGQRAAASWLLSARASRGTGIVAGSMLNGITTRPAPQVAVTVSARSAAVPIRRWEIRFIPHGIFTWMRRRREEHFPIAGRCENYNPASTDGCTSGAGRSQLRSGRVPGGRPGRPAARAAAAATARPRAGAPPG